MSGDDARPAGTAAWCCWQWCAWVERGATRVARAARLGEVPEGCGERVRAHLRCYFRIRAGLRGLSVPEGRDAR